MQHRLHILGYIRLTNFALQVIAVSHPALAEYVDVIVLPIKGARSLASLLAGGGMSWSSLNTCLSAHWL